MYCVLSYTVGVHRLFPDLTGGFRNAMPGRLDKPGERWTGKRTYLYIADTSQDMIMGVTLAELDVKHENYCRGTAECVPQSDIQLS